VDVAYRLVGRRLAFVRKWGRKKGAKGHRSATTMGAVSGLGKEGEGGGADMSIIGLDPAGEGGKKKKKEPIIAIRSPPLLLRRREAGHPTTIYLSVGEGGEGGRSAPCSSSPPKGGKMGG